MMTRLDLAILGALESCCPNRVGFNTYLADIKGLLQQELPSETVDGWWGRAEEFVVAYGCGWRRPLDDQEIWPKAFEKLSAWFREGLEMVDTYLSERVPGYDVGSDDLPREDIAAMINRAAEELAYWFCRGTCTCGLETCFRRHQLSAWNPEKAALRNFVLQAVKGSSGGRGKRILPGELLRSMGRYLLIAGGVLYENVPYWKCCCKKENVYGAPCKSCGTAFDNTRHRVLVRRWLVSTSTHQEQEFWHCQNEECGNYYQEEMDSCPLCKQERGRGAARSHLWVPRPSLEGPHVQERPEPGIGLEDRVVDRLQVQNVLGGLDPRYAQVLGLYAKGYESNEIAQRLGIPTEEAPRWLRDAKNAFVELWHAEEIARLTEEGYSEADIAGELGVPKSKVRDALKRARLKLADPQSREGSVQR